jgi:glyoxylase-like metal-dependent hydrolase (beta-lactamase superfamily II)
MHPNHEHASRSADDPELALARRIEVGRQSGVSEQALRRYAERFRELPAGVAEVIEPDRTIRTGAEIETDLGIWTVYETPGHAPSHICLFQSERRVLLSGDHLLGRISLYYDFGWTPDPVGEFLQSLDVVDRLDARLCLSGHGRPFVDVHGHVEGNRGLVRRRLDSVLAALEREPLTGVQVTQSIYDERLSEHNAGWLLPETLCYLTHLERLGRLVREREGEAERWRLI